MIKSIALASLVASPRNVRRSSDPGADAQLEADIAARGLLQNLVVTPAKPRGRYAVEAGGRRLRALQSLQSAGALPADHKVDCLVLGGRTDEVAVGEASLAENLQRLAMNPADECLAFGSLIEAGADIEGVARRFGLTVRHVEGRLRLAGLHPVVFAALGAGEIILDAAKAYATTSDQDRQLWVFEQLNSAWGGAHPDSIRRMMVNATVPATDRRLRFVGEEAYLAAGGRLERDLFAEADDARVLDVAILEQLAIDKLEVEAAWLANEHGYGFVRATLDTYVQLWQHDDLRRAVVELPERSAEEREEVEALEAEIDRLVDLLEDEDAEDFDRDEGEARIAQLEAQRRDIENKPPVLPPEVRAEVGLFLLLDEAGRPRLDPTPYSLVVDKPAEQLDTEEGSEGSARSAAADSPGTSTARGADSDDLSKPKRLPQRLLDELAMQRRDVLAYHVARDTELAFDLAVFLMVKDEGGYCYDSAGSSLSARPAGDPVLRSAVPDAPVQVLIVQAGDALDRSWTVSETLAARFEAFRALPLASRQAWLGAAVARTLEASTASIGRRCAFHDHLGTVLAIDVAQHWRPTAHNWFDRVPKARCLAALAEVGGPELAARHAAAKKAEIAEACAKLFSGEGIMEAEVKAAALAWVPEPMRFSAHHPDDVGPPWLHDETATRDDAAPGAEQIEGMAMTTGEGDLDADLSTSVELDADTAGVLDRAA